MHTRALGKSGLEVSAKARMTDDGMASDRRITQRVWIEASRGV